MKAAFALFDFSGVTYNAEHAACVEVAGPTLRVYCQVSLVMREYKTSADAEKAKAEFVEKWLTALERIGKHVREEELKREFVR